MQEWGIYLSGGTLIALILAAIKMTWMVRDLKDAVRKDVKDDMTEIVRGLLADIKEGKEKHENFRSEADQRDELIRKEIGEVGSALRTKIHEIETWARDEFVRKESLSPIIGRIERSIEKMDDKMEKGFAAMADNVGKRLDQLIAMIKPAHS